MVVELEFEAIDKALPRLRCPATGGPLHRHGNRLLASDYGPGYEISPHGIPLFADAVISQDGRIQQAHYEQVQASYHESRKELPVEAYDDFLNSALLAAIGPGELGRVAEICCGAGETLAMLGDRVREGIGLDVSQSMLAMARARHAEAGHVFLQGDATCMPLASASFDHVFMRGGIHHVPDRLALFREVARILKPGGRFYFLEPLDDFFLWRWLRSGIYRVSSLLDEGTEQPLRHRDTVPVLRQVGLEPECWRSLGAFGFCLFANTDVLVFNRIFGYLPGIRAIVQGAILCDRLFVSLPGLSGMGLQVVGGARKR